MFAPVRNDQRRARAAEIVAALTGRLGDPAAVAHAAETAFASRGVPIEERWDPGTLATGHPGISLLHTELATADAAHRDLASRHLSAYTGRLGLPSSIGLSRGMAGVGFAIATLARQVPAYDDLLAAFDVPVQGGVADVLYAERDRVAFGAAGTRFQCYDVLDGLAGVGGYLLSRRPAGQRALRMVLRYLTSLTDDVSIDDELVPGWYVGPGLLPEQPEAPQLNVGLANGIAGPLALLAIARSEGVRVPGDDRAIRHIVEWLLAERRLDTEGVYWPYAVIRDQAGSRTYPDQRAGNGWCSGTLGVTRAIQLAAATLERPDWAKIAATAAVSSVRVALERTEDDDNSLCHGWAGLLQMVWRMRQRDPDTVPADCLDAVADRLIASYDPDAPFGFRCSPRGMVSADRAGFMDGATGIALALRTYATNMEPATNWDRALLLA